MLVLSRRPLETIVFPNLGITVKLVKLGGASATIGVEAPKQVRVIRGELTLNPEPVTIAIDTIAAEPSPPRRHNTEHAAHEVAKVLNRVALSLHLFRKQQEAGLFDEADATLSALLARLGEMDRDWILDQLEPSDAEDRLGDPKSASAVTEDTSAKTVLLVEDEPNERALLAGLLRLCGLTCHVAADGAEALAFLSDNPTPDLVLLDMRMPRCDGPTALRAIRSNPRFSKLKVFSVSGESPDSVGIEPQMDRLNGWFAKPLDPTALVRALSAAS